MDKQQILQAKLEEILGSRNVYYQPPESLKMEYPAIRYSKSNIRSTYADNVKYKLYDCYEIIVIDRRPDSKVIDKILELPLSYHNRRYTANNLNHDSITLYF